VLKQLDIQNRQMNCSVSLAGLVVIGCRDRRVFVFNKALERQKIVEVPESVHCMAVLKNEMLAIGMTDGNVMLF
jgi:hypothetical protein